MTDNIIYKFLSFNYRLKSIKLFLFLYIIYLISALLIIFSDLNKADSLLTNIFILFILPFIFNILEVFIWNSKKFKSNPSFVDGLNKLNNSFEYFFQKDSDIFKKYDWRTIILFIQYPCILLLFTFTSNYEYGTFLKYLTILISLYLFNWTVYNSIKINFFKIQAGRVIINTLIFSNLIILIIYHIRNNLDLINNLINFELLMSNLLYFFKLSAPYSFIFIIMLMFYILGKSDFFRNRHIIPNNSIFSKKIVFFLTLIIQFLFLILLTEVNNLQLFFYIEIYFIIIIYIFSIFNFILDFYELNENIKNDHFKKISGVILGKYLLYDERVFFKIFNFEKVNTFHIIKDEGNEYIVKLINSINILDNYESRVIKVKTGDYITCYCKYEKIYIDSFNHDEKKKYEFYISYFNKVDKQKRL